MSKPASDWRKSLMKRTMRKKSRAFASRHPKCSRERMNEMLDRSITEIEKSYNQYKDRDYVAGGVVADVLYLLDIITRLVGIIRMLSIGDDWERRVNRAREILAEMGVRL
jgi:hypothetical protein